MQQEHYKWHWRYRQKLIQIAVIIVLSVIGIWYLSDCPCHADAYNYYVFQPFQLVRNLLFGKISFSIGDIMYVCWGIGLVALLAKWVYYLVHFKEYGEKLKYSVVKLLASIMGIYFMLMVGWGGNYYKEPLANYWHIDTAKWDDSSIIQFDQFLVGKLNETVPQYQSFRFKEIRSKARTYYGQYTDCYRNGKGLTIKPSLFGNWMKYMGVQGYYNPFTGEGQVNTGELHFMLPYVTCHEMAHQAGVGAEDDANLLAYALCVNSGDPGFRYSAYFNVWLYTHMQLRMRDTVAANAIRETLNPVTVAHLKALREERRKYRSKLGAYTGDVYDQYLKLNGQKDGIESYDKVTVSAWLWEQQRNSKTEKLYIP